MSDRLYPELGDDSQAPPHDLPDWLERQIRGMGEPPNVRSEHDHDEYEFWSRDSKQRGADYGLFGGDYS